MTRIRNLLYILSVVLWGCHWSACLTCHFPCLVSRVLYAYACLSLFRLPPGLAWPSPCLAGPGTSFSLELEGTYQLLTFHMLHPVPWLLAHFWNFLLLSATSEAAFRKAQIPPHRGPGPASRPAPISPSCEWRRRDLNSSPLLRFCLLLTNHWDFDRGVTTAE